MSEKELKDQLQEANRVYTECLSKEFLPRFINGQDVDVREFCVKEYDHMITLDMKVYGKLVMSNI